MVPKARPIKKSPPRSQVQERRIEQFTLDERVEALRASLGVSWTAREEAIRSAAYRLGFQRTGRAIREAFKAAINGAIRRGLIERQGPLLIRKVKGYKQ